MTLIGKCAAAPQKQKLVDLRKAQNVSEKIGMSQRNCSIKICTFSILCKDASSNFKLIDTQERHKVMGP